MLLQKKKIVKKKVSLVLSSGGARGIAHIAVIDELESRGYEICSIAGTSMGAFIGGVYASGNLAVFKEWMYSLKTREIIKLFDFSFSNNGLVKGEKIFQELGKIFPDQNIEEMPLPYVAISTDMMNNKEVVHDRGSLFHAMRASISIPTFFKPLQNEDILLVDGGLLNPVPVNRIKRFKGDALFVVNVETLNKDPEFSSLYNKDSRTPNTGNTAPFKYHGMPGYLQLVNKTIGIMLSRLSDLTIEKYKPDLLMEINRELFGTYDFHKYHEIMEVGKAHAKVYIDRWEKGNNK
jgi:NTE family protein